MLLTPPSRVGSANVFPQHVVYWSQHLQREVNALGVDLGDATPHPQCDALGIIQARDEVPAAEIEDATPHDNTTFDTTGQTSSQIAGMGMFSSAALRGNTTEKSTTETAAALDTTPVGLTLDLRQFDGGDFERNEEEGEGMSEEVGDGTNQGKDFLFPIERGLIFS